MTIFEQLTLLILYRLVPMLLGLLIIRWGYKLYREGISLASAGDINAVWGDIKIVIQNAAPGTILIIVGAAISIASVFKGGEIKKTQKNKPIESPSINVIIPEDSLPIVSSKQVNVDSMYQISKKKLEKKQFLEAYRYLYMTKGLLLNDKTHTKLRKEVELDISAINKELGNLINLKKSILTEEETNSITINDETLDSIK